MPPTTGSGQVAPAEILKKLGTKAKQMMDAHKNDATNWGRVGMPPGIENGVGQVINLKLGTFKTGNFVGEPFFHIHFMVKSPKTFVDEQGQIHDLEGAQFNTRNINLGAAQGPEKQEKGLAAWQDEIRKLLGKDVPAEEAAEAVDLANIFQTMQELEQTAPHFKFRTWRGRKRKPGEPGYNEQYDGPNSGPKETMIDTAGACSFDGSTADEVYDGAVVDDTPPARTTADKPTSNGAAPARAKTKTPEAEYSDQDDLSSLVQRATDGDGAAQSRLEEMAVAAGKTMAEIDKAPNWETVMKWISAGDDEPDQDAPDEAGGPSVGETYKYMIKDAKGKPKKIEVEVLSVSDSGETVTLKDLTTNKTIMSGKKAARVPADSLLSYD